MMKITQNPCFISFWADVHFVKSVEWLKYGVYQHCVDKCVDNLLSSSTFAQGASLALLKKISTFCEL